MKNYLSGKDYTVGLESVVQVAFGELVVSLSVFVSVVHPVLALLRVQRGLAEPGGLKRKEVS